MGVSTENGTTLSSDSRLNIEAVQTIVPLVPSDQKQLYRFQLPNSPSHGFFQRSFQLLICHNKALDENFTGYVVAGFFKESLGKVLIEHPVFAGRLRKLESGANDGENLEIVTTDSGVRTIEANIQMNLDEFLDFKGQTEAEADLVLWENINEENPQYSPLCFVQVTNFNCGGFSIGISCSLLMTDPLSILSFVERWSDIHKSIVSSTITPKIPLFHLPTLGTVSCPPIKLHSCKGVKTGQSVTFSIETERSDFHEDHKMYKNLAAWCLDEAEQKVGKKMARSKMLSFFLKETSGDVKIESCTREEVDCQDKSTSISKSTCRSGWDGLRIETYFSCGSNQSHASSWINSDSADEGVVMVTPSSTEDGLRRTIVIMVTTPT